MQVLANQSFCRSRVSLSKYAEAQNRLLAGSAQALRNFKNAERATGILRQTGWKRPNTLKVSAIAEKEAPTSNTTDAAKKMKNFKIAVFSSAEYVKEFLEPMVDVFPKTKFIEDRLELKSAAKAKGYDAVCLFVNDSADAEIVKVLAANGVKYIVMRCAGFDRVDLEECAKHGIKVARVPTYSPASVAEMALALLMTIARKIHLAYNRTRDGNYTVSGLVGWEIASCNVGVVGTGAIGAVFAKLALGFQKHTGERPKVYCYDLYPRQDLIDLGVEYVDIDTLLKNSDVVSLHCPLLPSTFHIINEEKIKLMKDGALLVNVSRGGLVDTGALLEALYQGKFGGVAMDVYEKEGNLFFKDYTRYSSEERLANWDREFAQLKTLPNVVITSHIAFMTREALQEIQTVTTHNLTAMCLDTPINERNEVKFQPK